MIAYSPQSSAMFISQGASMNLRLKLAKLAAPNHELRAFTASSSDVTSCASSQQEAGAPEPVWGA